MSDPLEFEPTDPLEFEPSDPLEFEPTDADGREPDGLTTGSDADDAPGMAARAGSDGSTMSRRRLVALSVGVVAGIGGAAALAWALLGRDSNTADPATTQAVDGSLPATANTTANTTPNNTADTATIADDFARPDSTSSLGTAATGQSWESASGVWGIIDGEAYVATPNTEGGGRSIALVDLGSGDGSVSATASTIANGWGLVFRYLGPLSYWMLQASTDFSTYNLQKVVGGEVVSVTQGGIGLTTVTDGTRVGVQFHGRTIGIMLDDLVVKVFEDSDLQNATQVGMVVSQPGASTARWSDFTAQADPPTSAALDGDG